MPLSKHFLIGLISLAFVGVALLIPPIKEAEAIFSGSFGNGCENLPTWKGPIPGKLRFVPTYIDKSGKPHAYCDRQTGIVLEKRPSTSTFDWNGARFHCANLTVGDSGQKGWRLLYIQELAALVDTNSKSCTDDFLCLPDGHPFKDVQSNVYWSASADADNPTNVWLVDFIVGNVILGGKDLSALAWCGRGASAVDAY